MGQHYPYQVVKINALEATVIPSEVDMHKLYLNILGWPSVTKELPKA
jgi:hypothetical protein